MITDVKTTQGGTGQTTASPDTASAGAPQNPFTKASLLHTEPGNYDQTVTLGAGTTVAPIFSVPAYGFLRGIWLKFILTGTGGTPALAGDNPFSSVTDITLQEPNGMPIYQVSGNGGYNTFLVDKYLGYAGAGQNDPKLWQGYSAAAATSTFWLYVPVEIAVRDALAALPNQNSGAMFQLRIGVNNLAGSFGGTPPTAGTLRIQAFVDAWDQPAPAVNGAINQVTPPAVNTTQYITQQSIPFNTGQNVLRLPRVGNWIRSLIFVLRDGSGVRTAAALPTQLTLSVDSQPVDIVDTTLWAVRQSRRGRYFGTIDTAGAQDTGVFVWDMNHDWNGMYGFETRNQWLETATSTRFELSGNFLASGTLTVITNDVIIADDVFL